jgi:two-component sensor histidine kinase
LTVSDDGIGSAKGLERVGLGSKIVAGIVSQLGATMEKRATEHGYCVEIEIPMPAG